MNQKIGNVGLLNLMDATEESIKGIEKIENVGLVLYRKENAHLLTSLNIGNIGASVELPEGYSFYNGILTINQAYFQSITQPVKLFVNGIVIIEEDVQSEQMMSNLLHLIVNGKVYIPIHLSGVSSQFLSAKGLVETYDGQLPRVENGELTLTNSFLSAFEKPLNLIVNGMLSLAKDLDMVLFSEKIKRLEVNGKITVYEGQEVMLYKKISSLTTCMVEIIPNHYEVLKKTLRINSKSIQRFKNMNLYTKKPILFEDDIKREVLEATIAKIHSSSIIICQEQVEDLIYEHCSLLETEVLAYEHTCVLIEGDEEWSNNQFLSLEYPINFIVDGKLKLAEDVQPETLRNHVSSIDILGKVVVSDTKLKGMLQQLIRLNTGTIELEGHKEEGAVLKNVGELTL